MQVAFGAVLAAATVQGDRRHATALVAAAARGLVQGLTAAAAGGARDALLDEVDGIVRMVSEAAGLRGGVGQAVHWLRTQGERSLADRLRQRSRARHGCAHADPDLRAAIAAFMACRDTASGERESKGSVGEDSESNGIESKGIGAESDEEAAGMHAEEADGRTGSDDEEEAFLKPVSSSAVAAGMTKGEAHEATTHLQPEEQIEKIMNKAEQAADDYQQVEVSINELSSTHHGGRKFGDC